MTRVAAAAVLGMALFTGAVPTAGLFAPTTAGLFAPPTAVAG